MVTSVGRRPALSTEMSAHEFERWYWLKTELMAFARVLRVSASGSKDAIAARVCEALDPAPLSDCTRTIGAIPASDENRTRRESAKPPGGELTAQTVVLSGQRCTQALRAWFVQQLGPTFRFDASMRSFFSDADGSSTLGDALAVWHATRGCRSENIAAQFELNRFTRRWYEGRPASAREEFLAGWAQYRDTPVDERGRA